MVPDPSNEKLPPLFVPVPVKENENAVWALAGLGARMIAAAIKKIQDMYFLRVVASCTPGTFTLKAGIAELSLLVC